MVKERLMENENRFQQLHKLAFAKRPAEELYDLAKDPGQLNNVAKRDEYVEAKKLLSDKLQSHLEETKDPRALGLDAPWDYYPYYGNRKNKNWKVDTKP